MENSQAPRCHRRRRAFSIHTISRSLAADELHLLIRNKMIEHSDRIGPAPDTGKHFLRKFSFRTKDLLSRLLRDDRLKIPDDRRERMRPHDTAQAVVRITAAIGPLTHRLVDSILQSSRAAVHRMNTGSQELHAVDIERLPLGIEPSHINITFKTQQCGCCCGGHPVLACSRLGDQPCLAHAFRKERLSEHIVDLVSPCMVQILSLEVDFCTAQISCHLFGKIEKGRTVRVLRKKTFELTGELRIPHCLPVGGLELTERIHECLRDVLSSVNSKSSFFIHRCFPRSVRLLQYFAAAENVNTHVNRPLFRIPCGFHKALHFLKALSALRILDTGRDVDPERSDGPDSFLHVVGREAAGENERCIHIS